MRKQKRTALILTIFLALILLFSFFAHGAEEYSWTDESNIETVHKAYSSTSWSRYQSELDYGSDLLDEDIHVNE